MSASLKLILPCITLVAALNAIAQDAPWLTDARKVASSVPPRLLQVLNEEIAKGGPESAIVACSEKAPQMAKAASEQSGWMVRRVALRTRTPRAPPAAWERVALEESDRRAAAGENPATLEAFAIVEKGDGKEARYMKALPVQQVCLACHGPADKLTPEVSAKLRALYPEDKGVGYNIGQIRGAMTIRKAM